MYNSLQHLPLMLIPNAIALEHSKMKEKVFIKLPLEVCEVHEWNWLYTYLCIFSWHQCNVTCYKLVYIRRSCLQSSCRNIAYFIFVLFVKFQITYKRMHGDGRSASSMVAAVRWKNKAYVILVQVWYSFLYSCCHVLYVHISIFHTYFSFYISPHFSNVLKCCWGTPNRFCWRSSSKNVHKTRWYEKRIINTFADGFNDLSHIPLKWFRCIHEWLTNCCFDAGTPQSRTRQRYLIILSKSMYN